MGFSRKRIGRDGKPRYTAYYADIRGQELSAGTFSSKKAPLGHHQHRRPARDLAELAATAGDLPAVLAAVHHAADVLSRIAACDTEAVRVPGDSHWLYQPTRLLPEHYDIPCLYAPLPPPLAAELLGAYRTAAEASLRAALALDTLAVAADSPSSTLAAARVSSGSPVTAPGPADDEGKQRRAQPAPPVGAAPPQVGQIENILHSLHITEPAMLLRAAAIDDAARDVLAHASASSRQRDRIGQQPRQRKQRSPGQPPRTAAKDVILVGAELQQITPEGRVSARQAGCAPRRATPNSRGHSPAG